MPPPYGTHALPALCACPVDTLLYYGRYRRCTSSGCSLPAWSSLQQGVSLHPRHIWADEAKAAVSSVDYKCTRLLRLNSSSSSYSFCESTTCPSAVAVPWRHAPDTHLYAQTLEMRDGLGQSAPELRAIRVLAPAPLGDLHPPDAVRSLERAALIPIAIAVGPGGALVAAAPQDCGWLACAGLLSYLRCRPGHERTPPHLPVLGLGGARQEGGQLLCLHPTWRYLLWHMGVLLLHRRVIRLTHVIPLPQKGLPPNRFYRDYRT
jgi:hypothetical protein